MKRCTSSGLRSDRRSVVAVWVALSIVPLLGIAALAVDMGYLYVVRNQLQVAVDAAALAGAIELQLDSEGVKDHVMAYAAKNEVFGQPVALQPGDIEIGYWDPRLRIFTPVGGGGRGPSAIRVTALLTEERGNPVELFLAGILGHPNADVVASAVAASEGGDTAWDVILVQDVTGSFTAELPDAREAHSLLLDCIATHTSGTSRVGVAAFSGCGATLAPMQALDVGLDALEAAIESIERCGNRGMPPCQKTNQAAGLEEAVNMFSATPSAPADLGQAIVLVSDGKPNPVSGACFPDYYPDGTPFPGNPNKDDLGELAMQWADVAWEEHGLSIFTVFYNEGNDSEAGAFLAGLARGEGIALETPDPSELPALLAQVCVSLPVKLVD